MVSHMFVQSLRLHGPLLRSLIRREIRQRYKGSVLGLGWNLVLPGVLIATYTFVFRYIFRSGVEDYSLFLATGMGAWGLFATGGQVAASSLIANANLIKKVRFPREIIPLSVIAGNAFTAGALILVALVLCVALRPIGLSIIMLPVFLVLLGIFTIGFGLMLSSVNVYFRDVEFLYGALTMPWFFITPILFAFSDLPPAVTNQAWILRLLHYANPVTPFLFGVQDSMFWGRWPSLIDFCYSLVAAALMLGFGLKVFRRLEPEMAVEL